MGRFADRKPIVCECGDHAFVAVTRGLTTMVSPGDAWLLEQRWSAAPHHGRHRVSRNVAVAPGRYKNVNLGRAVLGLDDGTLPDHINSDPLDNRRSNLRPATIGQNACNKRPKPRSLPKGVTLMPRSSKRYRATIAHERRDIFLGSFDTPEEAHAAYAEAAIRYHGEFARPK